MFIEKTVRFVAASAVYGETRDTPPSETVVSISSIATTPLRRAGNGESCIGERTGSCFCCLVQANACTLSPEISQPFFVFRACIFPFLHKRGRQRRAGK